jgi:MFS superfamily sulfate permease-like transporter
MLAGSPLQVSGPAAGLAVIVFEIVREQGLSALGPILILAGAIQVIAGLMRVGGWFRAISPAVVHGMLAGIGVLIVVGQFHVLFDDTPLSSGLANLLAMPAQLFGLSTGDTVTAFTVGMVTIGGMLGWEKFRPASLKLVPGALVGVLLATLVAFFLALPVARVVVPESIVAAVTLPEAGLFATMMDPAVITIAIAIAFIASAETLLSAAAVDRMHDGVRTDYNRELSAQGVGNLLCGFAGALPMTGVIVRSSANVQAGAKTRMSAVLHGVWILGFVALLPWLLREIPMAALAGILVVTGVRLVSVDHVRHLLHRYGPLPAIVWAATLICVVTTDLLTGVLVGIGLSMLELIPHLSRLRLKLEDESRGDAHEVALRGSATFLTLPKLSAKLDSLPSGGLVILNVERLGHIDHTTAEMVREWVERRRGNGSPVELFGATGRMRQLVA